MAQISKKVKVNEEIIGRRLSRDVNYSMASDYSLIGKNTVITPEIYPWLIKKGIEEVFVYEETEESQIAKVEVNPKFEQVKTEYILNTNKLTSLLDEVVSGHSLNVGETSKLCAEITKSGADKFSVFMFLNSLRAVDDYLYSHSVNVATLAGLFGKWLGYSEYDLECLTMCGLLHDIGKTKIDINILNKEQKLTDLEFSEIKTHTVKGYELLKHQNVPDTVKEVAYMHHEKMDGLGYPRALKQEQISEHSRIIAIIDIFDAMSHARVYRKRAHSPFYILKEFQEGTYGKLDTSLLSVFLQNVAYMYVGNRCKLSDGREGKIVFINPRALYAPIVEIDGALMNLQYEKKLEIDSVMTD